MARDAPSAGSAKHESIISFNVAAEEGVNERASLIRPIGKGK